MSKPRFDIEEYDEAGNLVATYVQSLSRRSEGEAARVDVVLPGTPKSVWNQCLDVFLPSGYPQSVTDDYLMYQVYDSLQAFSSSMAAMLSSRAVLEGKPSLLDSLAGEHADIRSKGVGVGDASASPTAALLLSVLQESAGRIATILFAHRLGTSLEPECKMYRLAADFFNDTALILDCLSPAFPKPIRVLVLSFSSILRALCGVAAGSSKASLSAHFAKWGNLGELNAKDSSQETVISLMGMLVCDNPPRPGRRYISDLIAHAGRQCTGFTDLNPIRDMDSNASLADNSPLDEYLGVNGYCRIGVSLQELMKAMSKGARTTTGTAILHGNELARLFDLYSSETYILWFDWEVSKAYILLKQGTTAQSQLKAWCQGLLLAHKAAENSGDKNSDEFQFAALAASLEEASKHWDGNTERLQAAGWDLDICALETRSGTRLVCKS
ncbi:hypothetical protein FKW77_007923 [Venturia effusa]|uniref:Uncharacterized protein n=1 Tax=Venturia effusa TaxID=50376 RepID=A0A517LLW7_9PEZI|nr:hypothetical protein FKW77_007923 [Venturia effusa]